MSDNLTAWDIQIDPNLSKKTELEKIEHLVSWAILAPNAHNSQPWLFRWVTQDASLEVILNPDNITIEADKDARESVISLGCALHNLILAAKFYQVYLNHEILETNPEVKRNIYNKVTVAKVFLNLKKMCISNDGNLLEQLENIKNRKMNRGKYSDQTVPEEFINALKLHCQAVDKVKLNVISDSITISAISELQYMAVRTVIAIPGFRKELNDHILLNTDQKTKIGMFGHNFGMTQNTAQNFKNDLSRPGLLNPKWANGFAMADRDGIKSAPVIIVLSCQSDTPADWITIGHIFNHCALLAQKYNLAVAYNAALIESKALNMLLRIRLKNTEKPLSVFRVGYATEEFSHSPRLLAREVIIA